MDGSAPLCAILTICPGVALKMHTSERPFPAYHGDGAFVFVCYSHRDASRVQPELAWLHDQAVNVWYDEGIGAGTQWRDEIARAIKNAKVFLYFISPDSAVSEHCRREVNFASEQGIPIISIYLAPTDLPDGLNMTLSERQSLSRFEMSAEAYREKLAARLGDYVHQEISPGREVRHTRRYVLPLIGAAIALLIATIGLVAYVFVGEDDGALPAATTTAAVDPAIHLNDWDWFNAHKSVAVLPFANLSTSDEFGFFGRGLSEEILDRLAKVSDLDVASRTSSFQAADRGDAIGDIGRALNVDYILEGSVRASGDQIRVTAQLIHAANNLHLWSKTYDRDIAEGFAMQSAVADNIATIVESEIQHDVLRLFANQVIPGFIGIKPIALQHYWDAQHQFIKQSLGEGGDIGLAEHYNKLAVAADPDFAAAWADLANLYMYGMKGRLSVSEASTKAHAAMDKAIALDPDNLDVVFQSGQLFLEVDWNYPRAEMAFNRVLSQSPKCGWCYVFLARIAGREGRNADAAAYLASADALEWSNERPTYLRLRAMQLIFEGRFAQSIELCKEALTLTASDDDRAAILQIMALAFLEDGQIVAGEAKMQEALAINPGNNHELAAYLAARSGKPEEANRILQALEPDRSGWIVFVAATWSLLGDKDKAFDEIEQALQERDSSIADTLRSKQLFGGLQADPRFLEMVTLLESMEVHTEAYRPPSKGNL